MVAGFYTPKQMIFGQHVFQQVPQSLLKLKIQRVFIMYSKSALTATLRDEIKSRLAQENISSYLYEMPKGEPTTLMLDEACKAFYKHQGDGVLAIGGGSTIDLAKAVAALAKDEKHSFMELAELETITRFPIIAVPTTAGTGSEATKISVLTDSTENVKHNPGHPDLIPDIAILDPLLTLNVPKQITAYTGLDALTHAIESTVSTKANDQSNFYAMKAIQLITSSIEVAYHEPINIEARSNMLLGSYYAGLAFSNSSTNLAHAMGRAIGTKWGLSHGQSVAIIHPFVVKFSLERCRGKYEQIAKNTKLESANQLVNYLMQLNGKLRVWESVPFIGSAEFMSTIDEMTNNAIKGNGILTNQQVPTSEDIRSIFRELHDFMNMITVKF